MVFRDMVSHSYSLSFFKSQNQIISKTSLFHFSRRLHVFFGILDILADDWSGF